MHYLLLLLVAAAPSFLITGYFFYRDRKRKAPKRMIARTFFVGLVVTLPALSLELILSRGQGMLDLSQFAGFFVKSFAVVAFSEEFFKLAVVIFFVYNQMQFNQLIDGVAYAILAALGFAAMENFLYGIIGGVGVAVWRYFTALPMHFLTAGIMGYYIGLAKLSSSAMAETKHILTGLVYAIAIHGFYDFILVSTAGAKSMTVFGVLSIFAVSLLIFQAKYRLATEASASF
ncbi:MAG: PrsW family intramembrane metalloprotease [Calditrichaeota bacterium]|nr:PrsW family intramembrane metalloprotease [Calditrichota bacterium]